MLIIVFYLFVSNRPPNAFCTIQTCSRRGLLCSMWSTRAKPEIWVFSSVSSITGQILSFAVRRRPEVAQPLWGKNSTAQSPSISALAQPQQQTRQRSLVKTEMRWWGCVHSMHIGPARIWPAFSNKSSITATRSQCSFEKYYRVCRPRPVIIAALVLKWYVEKKVMLAS